MSLWDAMMSIWHPTNSKFALFHLVDKLQHKQCHILMVLKVAKSYAHAMILALLPYHQWKFSKQEGKYAVPVITKWFKPDACPHVADAYLDPHKECVKNTSDKMLDLANMLSDDLYWATDPSPIDKKSLNDLVSTVKTVVSQRRKSLNQP